MGAPLIPTPTPTWLHTVTASSSAVASTSDGAEACPSARSMRMTATQAASSISVYRWSEAAAETAPSVHEMSSLQTTLGLLQFARSSPT